MPGATHGQSPLSTETSQRRRASQNHPPRSPGHNTTLTPEPTLPQDLHVDPRVSESSQHHPVGRPLSTTHAASITQGVPKRLCRFNQHSQVHKHAESSNGNTDFDGNSVSVPPSGNRADTHYTHCDEDATASIQFRSQYRDDVCGTNYNQTNDRALGNQLNGVGVHDMRPHGNTDSSRITKRSSAGA